MDAVYDYSRFNSLPKGYDWIRQEIEKDPILSAELVGVVNRYGNQATAQRIGYLLDTAGQSSRILKRLKRRIGDSKALIPWIPGRSARRSEERRVGKEWRSRWSPNQ